MIGDRCSVIGDKLNIIGDTCTTKMIGDKTILLMINPI